VTSYPAQLTQKPLSTKFSQPTLAIPVDLSTTDINQPWSGSSHRSSRRKSSKKTSIYMHHMQYVYTLVLLKRNKLRKGYFHDTDYGRKEQN
jgi:hypothetical protein